MKNLHNTTLLLLLLLLSGGAFAQKATQTIRGTVTDKQSEETLIGATVQVIDVAPIIGATTDENGRFRLPEVPIGRHELRITYMGYEPINVPNVVVTSGKEVVLDIPLEESVQNATEEEIVITANAEKDKANNELATISARSFSMEEVNRYSGGLGDPSRLARSFAGVSSTDDSRNDIVIRGNSPTGVQWRMEGAVIPNPNHFSTLGTTGGPVSMLNINTLRNSDFLTSAFPAEYGNVTGGVFDLGLRNGNSEKFEFTGQIGFNGFEAMAEGPISRKNNASFMAGYRYSVFGVIGNIVPIGTNAVPIYQDLTFKVNTNAGKAGRFSIFGIAGKSNISFLGKDLAEGDVYAQRDEDLYAHSRMGLAGVNHTIPVGEDAYIRTVLSASYSEGSFEIDSLFGTDEKLRNYQGKDGTATYSINSFYNKKFGARFSLRAGVTGTLHQLSLLNQSLRPEGWRNDRDFTGYQGLVQGYAQAQYKFAEHFTLNTGVHLLSMPSNGAFAAEPRVALNWNFAPKHTLNVGYGLHHQMQSLPVYFEQTYTSGVPQQTNADLGFSRSQHVVVGHDFRPAPSWRLKTEAYFQALDRVPVENHASPYSITNIGSEFVFNVRDSLVNEGKARNYGLEITVEKFFSKGYYGLFTASLFDSRYQAADGIWRNTAFNNRYVFNLLAGKEFKVGKNKNNAITMDFKVAYAGGRYYTPVDLAASMAAGVEVLDESQAFTQRQKDYFRLDAKIGFTLNGKRGKIVQRFSVDLLNVLNTQNIFAQRYDALGGKVVNLYQNGFFPDVLYRIQF